jgi:hypothetical protein
MLHQLLTRNSLDSSIHSASYLNLFVACSQTRRLGKFQLMIWLAALAFSDEANMIALETLTLVSTQHRTSTFSCPMEYEGHEPRWVKRGIAKSCAASRSFTVCKMLYKGIPSVRKLQSEQLSSHIWHRTSTFSCPMEYEGHEPRWVKRGIAKYASSTVRIMYNSLDKNRISCAASRSFTVCKMLYKGIPSVRKLS